MTGSFTPSFIKYKDTGIHTGEPSSITFFPSSTPNLKIVFDSFEGYEIPTPDLPLLLAQNGTVLKLPNGKKLYTPEHLLATCLPFWNQPLTLTVKGIELPFGDGSGLPLLTSLGAALEGIHKGRKPGFQQYESHIIQSYPVQKGEFKVQPAPDFSVTYRLQKGDINEEVSFSLEDPFCMQTYLEDILPARTFIFWEEYQICLKNQLLKGKSDLSGILLAKSQSEYLKVKQTQTLPFLDEYPFLNRNQKRMECELACHKILDLMGDLALLNLSLPKLKIQITNGSHYHNHLLLKDLIYERKNQ